MLEATIEVRSTDRQKILIAPDSRALETVLFFSDVAQLQKSLSHVNPTNSVSKASRVCAGKHLTQLT